MLVIQLYNALLAFIYIFSFDFTNIYIIFIYIYIYIERNHKIIHSLNAVSDYSDDDDAMMLRCERSCDDDHHDGWNETPFLLFSLPIAIAMIANYLMLDFFLQFANCELFFIAKAFYVYDIKLLLYLFTFFPSCLLQYLYCCIAFLPFFFFLQCLLLLCPVLLSCCCMSRKKKILVHISISLD